MDSIAAQCALRSISNIVATCSTEGIVYVRMRTYAMVQLEAYFGVIAISAPDSIKRLDFEEVFHVAYIFLHSYNKDI